MLERGLHVDHTTIYRWVQHYAPEIEKRCRPHLKATNDSWRVDETYVKVKKSVDVPLSCCRFSRKHPGIFAHPHQKCSSGQMLFLENACCDSSQFRLVSRFAFVSSLNIYDHSLNIFGVSTLRNPTTMVIVTNIWQKLNSIEREVTLIVTNFWQLFSQIIGETLLIVTNIWRNPTSFCEWVNS